MLYATIPLTKYSINDILRKERVIDMTNYTVKQIASMFKTNEETVRRWIRSGKLMATQDSKKSGNVISSASLNKFIKDTPKYAAIFTASLATSPIALSVVMGGMIGGMLALMDDKKKDSVSEAEIEEYLKKKVSSIAKDLDAKEKELKRLQAEILEDQQTLEKYRYILENLDLKALASEINSEKK